jgi:hypothetical protein
MGRPKRREHEPLFDPDLAEIPEGARWREWMGRVEAAIFASREPVAREAGRAAVQSRRSHRRYRRRIARAAL